MKNRTVAILLAFFLGVFGFHKFYLGKWGQGLLYILLAIISFGVIPAILGYLEAFIYLINNKQRFDMEYNFEYIQKQDYLNKKK